MLERFKKKIQSFITSKKDAPFLAALICGLTPMLFYYSNNYWAVNSWSHVLFFSTCFIGVSFLVYLPLYFGFKSSKKLKVYTSYLLFVLLFCFGFIFLSHTYFLSPNKRILLLVGLIALAVFLRARPREHYKKIIIFLFVFSSLSFFRIGVHMYEDMKQDYWLTQNDDILDVTFKSKPNVYLIQPDGYVAQSILEQSPYNYKTGFYDWLRQNQFKVYDDFRSNYPASLTSNSSLFAMRHHEFANMIFPEVEIANARESITTNNPVVSIFKSNDYTTYFIAQDEYFQQNRKQKSFDYFNIQLNDFPFYSQGAEEVRDVFADLKLAMKHQNKTPKFFFIEKLLPHHVGFYNTEASIETERKKYISKVEEVNVWLKNAVNYIEANDKDSVIIILADHGGWVGVKSFNHLFSAKEPELVSSIFSNIAAIKWNGYLQDGYDTNLRTNVNLFRTLFSVLSENPKYLEHLEDDSSYNLKLNLLGFKNVIKQINGEGEFLNQGTATN